MPQYGLAQVDLVEAYLMGAASARGAAQKSVQCDTINRAKLCNIQPVVSDDSCLCSCC